jgi:hypothetical protein
MYDTICQKSTVPLARDASLVKAYLASLFAGDDNEIYPYGVDPAFVPSSDVLYKPELQGMQAQYYNSSDPMQLPPTTNAPFGFFFRHLQVSIRVSKACIDSGLIRFAAFRGTLRLRKGPTQQTHIAKGC